MRKMCENVVVVSIKAVS